EQLLLCRLAYDHGYTFQASTLRCPPAPLARHKLIAIWPALADNEWLDNAMLLDRCRKLFQGVIVELGSRLARVLPDAGDSHFACAAAWRSAWKKRVQPTAQATTSLVHTLLFSSSRRETSSASALYA